MKVNVTYEYTEEEAQQVLGYKVIAEFFKLGSQPAKTMRGKRKWAEMFPSEEDDLKAQEVINHCKRWYAQPPISVVIKQEDHEWYNKVLKYVLDMWR